MNMDVILPAYIFGFFYLLVVTTFVTHLEKDKWRGRTRLLVSLLWPISVPCMIIYLIYSGSVFVIKEVIRDF